MESATQNDHLHPAIPQTSHKSSKEK